MSSHESYKALISRFQKPSILLVVMPVLTLMNPGILLILGNFKNILFAVSIYGVMIYGTVHPILLGDIDPAAGATATVNGVCAVLTTIRTSYSFTGAILGILLGPVAGVMTGTAHDAIVSDFNVPSFLTIFASRNIIYGATQPLTGNQVISCLEPAAFTFFGGRRLLGIPFSVCILVIAALISSWIFNRAIFGRQVCVAGGNKEASNLSGTSSKRIATVSYAISGPIAALAGVALVSMNQQAIAKTAQGYENDVFAAVVVGGTSLTGSEGSLQGTMFEALLVRMINNGLRLLGVPSTYHSVAKGTVIIVAITADAYGRYKNNGLRHSGILARVFSRKRRLVKPI